MSEAAEKKGLKGERADGWVAGRGGGGRLDAHGGRDEAKLGRPGGSGVSL